MVSSPSLIFFKHLLISIYTQGYIYILHLSYNQTLRCSDWSKVNLQSSFTCLLCPTSCYITVILFVCLFFTTFFLEVKGTMGSSYVFPVHFFMESWCLLLKNNIRTQDLGAKFVCSYWVSLLLNPLSWKREEICLHIYTHS